MNRCYILVGFLILLLICVYYIKIEENNEPVEGFKNLIDNGNFSKGEKIVNTESMNDNNEIVVYPNPGDSSYVLKQSAKLTTTNISEVIYKINLKVEPDKTYLISCWVSYSNNWNGKDDIFYMKLWKTGDNPEIKVSSGNILETKMIDNKIWEFRNYLLLIPEDSSGEIDLYIGYNPGNSNGFRYITNIIFELYYPLLKNFSITNGLQCFLSAFDNNSYDNSNHSKLWKDLSNNGNDFKWDNTPIWNIYSGFNTKTNKLVGNSLSSTTMNIENNNNMEFTILYYCQNKINIIGDVFTIYTENNQNNLTLNIDTFTNTIILYQGTKVVGSYTMGFLTMDILYTFTYNKGVIKLYINNIELTKNKPININNILLSNSQLVFNETNKWESYLYNIIIYNRIIESTEIDKIHKYLMYFMSSNMTGLDKKPLSNKAIRQPDLSQLLNYENPNIEHQEDEEMEEETILNESMKNILNNEWKELGVGWPKNQTKLPMGKGFSLNDCKNACLSATEPFKCNVFSVSSPGGEGLCNLYSNSNHGLEGVDYRDNLGKPLLSFKKNNQDVVTEEEGEVIEGFTPSFRIPKKYTKESFFATQQMNTTNIEKTKKIAKMKIKINQQLKELDIIENKHRIIFSEKIKKLNVTISMYSSNSKYKKQLLNNINEVHHLHRKYKNDIDSKRMTLLDELTNLESTVDNTTTLPQYNNTSKTQLNNNPLIDSQGNVISNANYGTNCPKKKCHNNQPCLEWYYDENGCQTCRCYKYRTNNFENTIFNRTLYNKKKMVGRNVQI